MTENMQVQGRGEEKMTVQEATKILTDEAERLGADANDSTGIVRTLVTQHGLGFGAWFCVCCELADRDAQKQGFRNQFDRALSSPAFQSRLDAYIAQNNPSTTTTPNMAQTIHCDDRGCDICNPQE